MSGKGHEIDDLQPGPGRTKSISAPTFYLTGRQPLRPGALAVATVVALAAMATVLYALEQTGRVNLHSGASRSSPADGSPADDKDDDPNQVDTVAIGDPADAPMPARRGDHVSPVHPTILVHLPRFGEQTGLIPDTVAGRLLYGWLAAFNGGRADALGEALPSAAARVGVAAQMEVRRRTGGFSLLSAKEVETGVLVFRLRDQTPQATEVLGTLVVRPNSSPATIASFSLRAVASARPQDGPDPTDADSLSR